MYTKTLSAREPGCFLVLIDQSGAMSQSTEKPGSTKATECAVAVNRVVRETALACQKGESISPRVHVGLIGYGGGGVGSVLGAPFAGRELVSISDLAHQPLRVDTMRQSISDGAGGLVEMDLPFPVWVEPRAQGNTALTEALQLARVWIDVWAERHRTSFPPVVINVTGSMPSAPDAALAAAEALRGVETNDGAALLFNAGYSTPGNVDVAFPDRDSDLPNDYARLLFSMSSVLPPPARRSAEVQGYDVGQGARGFVMHSGIEGLVRVLALGSQPTGAR